MRDLRPEALQGVSVWEEDLRAHFSRHAGRGVCEDASGPGTEQGGVAEERT